MISDYIDMDTLAPWLPVIVAVAAAVAVMAAIGRGMVVAYRHAKGRRAGRIIAIVTPMLDERFQTVDAAMLILRIEIGETRQVVDEVKAIIGNGLSEDVAYLRDRLDDLYDHLID